MGCFCFSGIRQALKNHICISWVFFSFPLQDSGLMLNFYYSPCVHHQIILELLHLVITLLRILFHVVKKYIWH